MKSDKMACPGLYVQFFKHLGETTFEVAAWVREDYTVKWTRPGHETWHTLMWNLGPRKGWEKKSESSVKKDYQCWWEKFDDLTSLRRKVAECRHIGLEKEATSLIPDLPEFPT